MSYEKLCEGISSRTTFYSQWSIYTEAVASNGVQLPLLEHSGPGNERM